MLGVGVLTDALFSSQRCDHAIRCGDSQYSTVLFGAGTLVVGAVMTPIGWIIYGVNKSPRLTLSPLVPTPHGAVTAATVKF